MMKGSSARLLSITLRTLQWYTGTTFQCCRPMCMVVLLLAAKHATNPRTHEQQCHTFTQETDTRTGSQISLCSGNRRSTPSAKYQNEEANKTKLNCLLHRFSFNLWRPKTQCSKHKSMLGNKWLSSTKALHLATVNDHCLSNYAFQGNSNTFDCTAWETTATTHADKIVKNAQGLGVLESPKECISSLPRLPSFILAVD